MGQDILRLQKEKREKEKTIRRLDYKSINFQDYNKIKKKNIFIFIKNLL